MTDNDQFASWANANDYTDEDDFRFNTLRKAYSAGVQAERERCARIAEKKSMTWAGPEYYNACRDIAAAIRMQG